MIKTYALLDVIDVKNALIAGKGKGLLEKFWQSADAWTFGVGNQWGAEKLLENPNAVTTPEVYVVTFSDSALLNTKPEFTLDTIFRIVTNFKATLERTVGKVYCVVSRGDEIAHHELPALGGTMGGSGGRSTYQNIAGSGSAWVNLHLADKAANKKNEWHDKFSLYYVGDPKELPPSYKAQDQGTFEGIDGNQLPIYAIR